MVFQLVIVQLVTFVAIVFVLRKLLYAESAKEMLRLKKLKEETADKQIDLQKKIDAAQDAYKEKMAEAEEASRAYNLKSKEEANELKKQVLDKANEEAEQIVRSAFNAKEKMREEIAEEIAEEMRKRAPMLISRIFKEFLSPAVRDMAHKELVRDVMDKIKKADKISFKSKVDKGEIVSARPISDKDKSEIELLIRDNLGYEVPLHGKEDGELVAGVIIKLGTILIDGSLDSRLKQVEKELGL